MIRINPCFEQIPRQYLFTQTAGKAADWVKRHPEKSLIRLGLGDVTRPIPAAAAEAMAAAALELQHSATFRGYGPEQGYRFLREAICRWDYAARGVNITPDEIYISDGIKTDCGALLELFDAESVIALCDPVYPAYVDAAAICGRAGVYDHRSLRWSKLLYLSCTAEHGFVPHPPKCHADLVYLCFPNNPTGAAADRTQLAEWVDWANDVNAVLLFDGAYESYITQENIPHSVFEINGAQRCCIELRSFSKSAGFTGVRCGYTVIPNELRREGRCIRELWERRLSGRSNGVSYPVQRGAQAIYSEAGQAQLRETIAYYQENAIMLRNGLRDMRFTVYGGENAPYVWAETPKGMTSCEFFDLLLEQCGVVVTPGVGFGSCGEGYVRLTAFGDRKETQTALERIRLLM